MSSVAASIRIHTASPYPVARRLSVTGMVGVMAVHAGVLVLLASLQVLPLPLATQLVQIMAPTPLTPPAPDITPPRPLPVERMPVFRPTPALPLPQTLAVPTEAPSAAAEVPQVMQAPVAAPADPIPAPATPATATVTQARFDADYLQNPPPAYPALSRRIGEEGTVVLRVFVETTGRPSQIEVKSASGSPRLDQAAQDAVWRWKFVSARRGMDAVGAWVLVPIVFSLRG
jgi:protein TonB